MRLLITSLLICFCMNKTFGQSDYEAQMLKLEQVVFLEGNDSIANESFLKKFNLSLSQSDFKRSFTELRRVNDSYINDSAQKADFYWNASLVSKLSGDPEYANIYHDLYLKITSDSSYASLLLGLLIKEELDTAVFNDFWTIVKEDSVFNCFDCLADVNSFKIKRKGAYIAASRLVPGLGTILAGDLFNGIGSILTVGGSGVGVYYLFTNQLYWGTGIWGYLFLVRFYKGNVNLTKDKIIKLEQKKRNNLEKGCHEEIQKVLIKYPIDFRLNQ